MPMKTQRRFLEILLKHRKLLKHNFWIHQWEKLNL